MPGLKFFIFFTNLDKTNLAYRDDLYFIDKTLGLLFKEIYGKKKWDGKSEKKKVGQSRGQVTDGEKVTHCSQSGGVNLRANKH